MARAADLVFAHGIGGAKDLPVPAGYAIAGAGLALAVSFVVLAVAWRTPRFDAATSTAFDSFIGHPTFLAVTKVLAVVTGHVLGVIAAHDRAIRLLPRRHQLTGQIPLVLVMVFYTVAGLYLLFSA